MSSLTEQVERERKSADAAIRRDSWVGWGAIAVAIGACLIALVATGVTGISVGGVS